MGAELMRNIRIVWWKEFIHKRIDMVGLDRQILLHPETWVASGHVGSFADPMVEDVKTHKRYRVDHLIEETLGEGSDVSVEDMTFEEMEVYLKENNIKSTEGNDLSDPMAFNLIFENEFGF